MPNWGKGAKGAGSGAATGAAIGSVIPGIGTAIGGGIGAGIGGLAGLFKKKKNNNDQQDYRQQIQQLVANLNHQNAGLQAQTPQSSAYYLAGQGQMADLMRNLTRRDAGAAASRGLAGTEYEIAQAARRQGTQADQQRQLLAGAERNLTQEQQNSIARLMQALGLLGNENARQDQRGDNQNAQLMQTLSTVAQTVPYFLNPKKGES